MLRRIANLFRGFISLFVSNVEKSNPRALLEAEKERFRNQIADFNENLAKHAALCESLIGRVKKIRATEQKLTENISANFRAGNRKRASEQAYELQSVKEELGTLEVQLQSAEERYKELTEGRDLAIKTTKDKISEIQRGIDAAKVDSAMAELNEMAAGLITSMGGSGETMDRLSQMVEEIRTEAAGRSRVARDAVDFESIRATRDERDALESQALEDFLAGQGIEVEDEEEEDETIPPPDDNFEVE